MKRIIYLFLLIFFVIIGEYLIFYNHLVLGLSIGLLGIMLILLIDQTTYWVKDTKKNQIKKLICIFLIMTEYLSLSFIILILLIKFIPDITFSSIFGTILFGIVFSIALYEGNFVMRDKKEYIFSDIEKRLIFMIFALVLFLITLRLSMI